MKKNKNYLSQGKDFFETPTLDCLRSSGRFQEFKGSFFRSTMNLQNKLSLLETFLARGNVAELPSLIEIFKAEYRIKDIPQRNADWRCFYDL